MDEEDIYKQLIYFDKMIQLSGSRGDVLLTLDWKISFPDKAGVYAFFKDHKIAYVGETGSIRGRMNDMRSSQHHTLRRNVGAHEFCDVLCYQKATSYKKFPSHIEVKVVEFLCKLQIAALPVRFGRKEIEEYLIATHQPIYNQKGKRSVT